VWQAYAVYAGIMLAKYAYHRWWEDKPVQKKEPQSASIPRTDEGGPVPVLFGRTLVRSPYLAYARAVDPTIWEDGSALAHLLYVVAIGCDDGRGTNRAHGLWDGDEKVAPQIVWTQFQQGNGGPEGALVLGPGRAEVLNGNPAQVLANDSDTSTNAPTHAGRAMLAFLTVSQISGYRGYISVFLYGGGTSPPSGWFISQGGVKAYAIEASSYHNTGQLATFGRVGYDMNIINAIYLLLVQKFGALGFDSSKIDMQSFIDAQYVCHTESNGCSFVLDAQRSGDEYLLELLKQADAAVDEDPVDGKVKIKLVRADFDPATLPEINRSNASKLLSFAAGGWTDVINRVRLQFTDRQVKLPDPSDPFGPAIVTGYPEGSVLVSNQGNSAATGFEEEALVEMRYVHERALAKAMAHRELAARSRPMMKFRAMCGRWARNLMRGYPIRVTWTNPDVAGLIFRVANVERGTLSDSEVAVDLIQDYMYTIGNETPRPPIGGQVDNPPLDNLGGG
jgi:hypothetical protein